MTTPLISVIIPAYNVREYLPTTLKNVIVDQFADIPPDEWELIVVDDGSTDGSHLETEPWIRRYPGSVKLIRKPNGGVSAARNDGLAAARGRYVYFMDADDLLLRNALPQLLDFDTDIVKFHFRQISDAEYNTIKTDVPQVPSLTADFYTAKDFLQQTQGMQNGKNHVATVVSLYRREFLISNSLRYDTEFANGEDELFIWTCMLHNPRIAYTDTELYLYQKRADSASNKKKKSQLSNYFAERIRFTGRMIPLLQELKNTNILDDNIFNYVRGRYHYFYQLYVLEMIVINLSITKLTQAMHYYKRQGGNVHPGRPRFTPYFDSAAMSKSAKLRRWIIAYPIASIIAIMS